MATRGPRAVVIFWIVVFLAVLAVTAFIIWIGSRQDLTALAPGNVARSKLTHGLLGAVSQVRLVACVSSQGHQG